MASSLLSTLPLFRSCRRFVAGLAFALFVCAVGEASLRAQIVAWSVSLPMPALGAQIYFDPVTGNTATDPDGTHGLGAGYAFYIFNYGDDVFDQTILYGALGSDNKVIYDGGPDALNLAYGATVSGSNLYWSGANLATSVHDSSTIYSNFAADATGFVGLKFIEGGETYYGWASIVRGADSSLVTLTGFGYNATPDAPALAGVSVPEPTTWGVLVGGSALAFAALRRRKLALAQ